MRRIHYVVGAFFIVYGTLVLLTLVGVLPLSLPSRFTVGYLFWALGVGMIPFGAIYILARRKMSDANQKNQGLENPLLEVSP